MVVGLQGAAVKSGDDAEVMLQLGEYLVVALGLPCGSEGMHVGELAPAQGQHLGCGVELHGAGA